MSIYIYVFWLEESKSDVHFRLPESENLYDTEETEIFRIIWGFQI